MSSKTLRDYLLETLDESETVSVEEQYFTNPEFLDRLKAEEERLIEDYLSGRLVSSSKTRFEEIYLSNPSLLQKVEAKRHTVSAESPKQQFWKLNWNYAFASLAVVTAAILIGFFMVPQKPVTTYEAKKETPALPPTIQLRLSPGVSKGFETTPSFAFVASGNHRLRTIFEMPGITGPVQCRAKLFQVQVDGSRKEIASSSVAASSAGPNSEAIFIFEHVTLPKADYLAELTAADGSVLEHYVFRAI